MQKPFILFLIYLCFSCNGKTKEVSSEQGKNMTASEIQLPSEIDGVYVVVNEPNEVEKCHLTITIEKAGKGYHYRLTSDTRSLAGEVSLELNEDEDGYYITFEGIEWSEYEGDITNGNYNAKGQLKIPVEINGLIQGNEITIQNHGNSMNSYVQLGECGKKYIILKKQLPSTQASTQKADQPPAQLHTDTLQFIHFEGNFDYWTNVFINAQKDTIVLVTDSMIVDGFKNKLFEVKWFIDTLHEAGDDSEYAAKRMTQFKVIDLGLDEWRKQSHN